MRALKAELRFKNDDTNQPELYMRGDRHWVLTFAAMIFETMKRDGNLDDEEAINLLKVECKHLRIDKLKTETV